MTPIIAAVVSFLLGLGLGSAKQKESYLIIEKDGTREIRVVKPAKLDFAPFRKDVYGEWTIDCGDYCED